MGCEINKICNCETCTKKSEWEPLIDVHDNKINWESFNGSNIDTKNFHIIINGVESIQAPKL